MAIEELKRISIFRPCVVRREKDADEYRRNRRGKTPPEERDAETDDEKGKVDIQV